MIPEAVISFRPVYDIVDDTPQDTNFLPRLLNRLTRCIRSVGAIEIDGQVVATAVLVHRKAIVTNRHVVVMLQARFDLGESVYLNFSAELHKKNPVRILVSRIRDVAADPSVDVAVMELAEEVTDRQPVELSPNPVTNGLGAFVIGHPCQDSNNQHDAAVLQTLFDDVYGVKRLSPGLVVAQNFPDFHHNASTLPGSSGSAVVDVTGQVVGLHRGGIATSGNSIGENYAVRVDVLRKLLVDWGIITPQDFPHQNN
eukprot:TRINITY_DN8413_c0_g1_i1.p1 TRINITY_DN8413_c0_g1~~TRINITY_DN8413_c0_g1_i1.p1  ORF type:complete len:295 (+),score=44.27 TRINITY_DN8413_c0_g1_i1:123-887(+)